MYIYITAYFNGIRDQLSPEITRVPGETRTATAAAETN